MNASLTRYCVVGLAASMFLVGASSSTSTPDYQGTAVIVSLHPAPSTLHATRPVVVLHHEPIVGLMAEKMSLPPAPQR